MSEDLVVSKEKLNQLASSKKVTTVEAAFDSDESDWSDDDGESTFAAKSAIPGDANTSKNTRDIQSTETQSDTQLYLADKDKPIHNFTTELDPQQGNAISRDASFSSPLKNNNFIKNLKTEEQQQFLSSPYFVKQSNSFKEVMPQCKETSSGREKTDAVTTQEKQNSNEQDDDDWDEESCIVNIGAKVNEKPTNSSDTKIKFFQPSSASINKYNAGQEKSDRKSSMVDWSETYSEAGSEAENEENCNDENLPADTNNQEEPEHVRSNPDEKMQTKIIETVDDGPDLIDISPKYDNLSQQSIPKQELTKSCSSLFHSRSPSHTVLVEKTVTKTPSTDTITCLTKAEFSGESLGSLDPRGDCDFEKQSLSNNLPSSSSSAAQLFRVASDSLEQLVTVQVPKGTMDLSTSSPNLIHATTTSKKKSKPSSAKHLFTRLFSTDSDKTVTDHKRDIPEPSIRKTSEPIPLSTLLLNAPVTMHSSDSESKIRDIQLQQRHHHSTSTPLIPSKYFPLDISRGHENPTGESESGTSTVALGPKKRKGFIGKMKKTLGITSKGSKMRASESMKNLPVVATTAAILNDPPFDNIEQSEERMISVQTRGRPADEIIIDLLNEGKRYLESTNHSRNPTGEGGGDGDTLNSALEHRKSTLDRLKRYSSENVLASFPGSSMISGSDISLVDGQTAAAEAHCQKIHKSGKMTSYYCSQAIPNTPNRQVIYNLIEDFCCVLDKSFGEQDRLKNDNGNLFSEIDQLRGALECSEASKTELERRFQEMQDEFQKLQFCLEEECQARANLEGIVCELKSQMDRQDEILNCELAEKADLLSTLKQLETDNWNLKNQLSDFSAERQEFTKSYRGFEGTKNKCTELQIALAECCEKHDIMQKEILDLRNENNEIKLKLDNCVFEKNQEINNILKNEVFGLRSENNEIRMKLDNCEFEKNKLVNEMETMKQAFAAEKAGLEAKVCELLEGIATLEKTKAEICKQTNTMLAAHHEEMDNLKAEADSYKAKFDEERKIRDDLEHRLRATKVPESSFQSSTHTHTSSERSPPLSFPSTARAPSSYHRPFVSSESTSLPPSATGGNRERK